MEEQKYLPPARPARKAGQEPTAHLTLDAYVRMRKELERLKTEGRDRSVSGFHRPTIGTFFGLLDWNNRKPEMLATHRIRVTYHLAIVSAQRLPSPKNAFCIGRNIYIQQLR